MLCALAPPPPDSLEARSLVRGALPGTITEDELAGAAKLLRAALNGSAVRVMDLFLDWDINGDGLVSAKEVRAGHGKEGPWRMLWGAPRDAGRGPSRGV